MIAIKDFKKYVEKIDDSNFSFKFPVKDIEAETTWCCFNLIHILFNPTDISFGYELNCPIASSLDEFSVVEWFVALLNRLIEKETTDPNYDEDEDDSRLAPIENALSQNDVTYYIQGESNIVFSISSK